MKAKPIAQVVMEYFEIGGHKLGSINDILKFYVDKHGKNNTAELQKARHAIYLKANRLVKSGDLIIHSRKAKNVIFTLAKPTKEPKPRVQNNDDNKTSGLTAETDALVTREAELLYELDLCIAEAQGYDEMKNIIPSQHVLLKQKKEDAKKRAISINGLLTSTQTILRELSR